MATGLPFAFAAIQALAAALPLVGKLLYKNDFLHYSKVSKESYIPFVGQAAYTASIERVSDGARFIDKIRDLLSSNDFADHDEKHLPLLLIGKAGLGKSQLVLDLAKEFGYRVWAPRREAIERVSKGSWLKWAKKDGALLFLDDLPSLVTDVGDSQTIRKVIRDLLHQRGRVLATCRTEALASLEGIGLGEDTFRVVEVPVWSPIEGRKLCCALQKEFDESEFDGSPVSLRLGFKRQKDVYSRLTHDGKCVIRAVKLLFEAGLLSKASPVPLELVRRAACSILTASDFHTGWTEVRASRLAIEQGGAVSAYEATLEMVVCDFPCSDSEKLELLGRLQEIFSSSQDVMYACMAAVSLLLSGYEPLAFALWSRAIEVDPTYAKAYSNRGAAFTEKGDEDRAIEDFTKAIQLDPEYVAAYYNRGVAFANKGDEDRAIEDYTKAIQLDPEYVAAYYNRGVALADNGDEDHAIADFTKAVELNPALPGGYYARGVAFGSKGDEDRAIVDLTMAIELDPTDADAYCNRGVAFAAKGNHSRAIEEYTMAIELDPTDPEAYFNRGVSFAKEGSEDHAIEDYTKAIELDPTCAKAYYNRGVAFDEKGDNERAIEDYTKATELEPSLDKK